MSNNTKICPYCLGEININAIKCKHCKRFLSNSIPNGPEENNTEHKNIGCLKTPTYIFCAIICFISLVSMLPPEEISEENSAQLKRGQELEQFENEVQKKRDSFKKQKETEAEEQKKEYERQQKAEQEEQAKREKLEILESYSCSVGFWNAVCGVVRNNKNRSVYMVSVDISTYDKDGNLVNNISDFIDEIKAGQTWKFKAIMYDNDAYQYQINGVSGW